jgi:L-rhamnose mutarotase
MKTYCLALDLKDNPELIAQYRHYHQPDQFWPDLASHIRSAGVINEQIFLLGTRMVMVLSTTDDFAFERQAVLNRANPRMQEWERLMDRFQKRLPEAKDGEKWVRMEKIFEI